MQTPSANAPVVPQGAPVAVEVGTPTPISIPLTGEEVQALRVRRNELSDQLTSAARRRQQVASQLEDAQGANRLGLEQRLQVLDRRIQQNESDIAVTGRALTMAPASALVRENSSPIPGLNQDSFAALTGVFILFVLAPIAIGMSRMFWRRGRVLPAAKNPEESARMERIEQAVDAIAIEVERISEAQRFTTRLLSETQQPLALNAAQAPAEPLRAREQSPVAVRREPA
jgi:hypothetical protein